jgi:hypothetical protein
VRLESAAGTAPVSLFLCERSMRPSRGIVPGDGRISPESRLFVHPLQARDAWRDGDVEEVVG